MNLKLIFYFYVLIYVCLNIYFSFYLRKCHRKTAILPFELVLNLWIVLYFGKGKRMDVSGRKRISSWWMFRSRPVINPAFCRRCPDFIFPATMSKTQILSLRPFLIDGIRRETGHARSFTLACERVHSCLASSCLDCNEFVC